MPDSAISTLTKKRSIVTEDTFLGTEYDGTGDSFTARYGELKNTIAGATTYIHPRGTAEYAGNLDYTNNLNWSYGLYSRMPASTRVRRIRTPYFMRNITGTMPIIELRVYRSTNLFVSAGGQNPQSNLTFVQSNLFFKGQMPTTSASPTWITLDSEITLAADEYLYVFAYAHSGCNVGTRLWSTAPSSGPARIGVFYNVGSGVNTPSNWFTSSVQTNWSQASGTSLGTVALMTEADYASALVTGKADNYNFGLTSIPNIIYLAVGREMNIYTDELFTFGNGQALTVDYNCSKGQLRDRGFRFQPVIGDIGDTTLTITVYDINLNIVNQQTVTIRVVSNTSGTGTKNILFIGDSLTFMGKSESSWRPCIVDEVNNLVTADGGIGASFIGKRGIAPALCEGRPGWTFADFVGLGSNYERFTVSGISVSPDFTKSSLTSGSEYTVAGNTYRIEDAFISGGSGTLVCFRVSGSATPSGSGTLTKSSGAGDATITYSAYASVNRSPLHDGTRLNLQNYISVNGLSAPDVVVVQLGINDCFSGRQTQKQIDDVANNCLALVNAITDATYGYPSARIVISLPPFGAPGNNAFGINYGSGFTPENFKRNLRRLWADLVAIFSNSNYSANVRVAASGLFVDRVNGYSTTTRAISARVSTNETVYNDAVHPAYSGYQQIADAVYSVIRSFY